jgi:hypothetical protein
MYGRHSGQPGAAIPEFLDPEGRLFTKVKQPEWTRPDSVELVGESELHFPRVFVRKSRDDFETDRSAQVHPPSDLLERFLDLRTASGSKLHRFARRYGPLGIFQWFGGPVSPNPETALANLIKQRNIELCEMWRYFATVMGALLRIAKSLYSNSPGDPKDWNLIADHPSLLEGHEHIAGTAFSAEEWWIMGTLFWKDCLPTTTREARLGLTAYMDHLLGLGKIGPVFDWASRSDRPQVLYAGNSLLSYLVLQLCLRMAKIDGYAFCDHCGKLYEPQRLPRSDRRNFCPTCQDNGISARLADRKRREKERIQQRHAVR